MGLGLYVARQMVREIHGDIWAESLGEGKGSTFFVKLPVEGSARALKSGTKLTVGIKAAEVGERSVEPIAKAGEKPDGPPPAGEGGTAASGKGFDVPPPEEGKNPAKPSLAKRKKPPTK